MDNRKLDRRELADRRETEGRNLPDRRTLLDRRNFVIRSFTGVGALTAVAACGGGGAEDSGAAPDLVAERSSRSPKYTAPTPAPTLEPTPAPTLEPTPAPTLEPTPAPTLEPAPEPTPAPTTASGSAPSWAPASGGEIKAVATANTFLSQNANLASWEGSFGKIVNDFSGGVFNPYWGSLGAMVFHGGGHSATFDNSVVILDLNDLTFKRLSNPTPSNNGANWIMTSSTQPEDPAFNTTYCEYGDAQPGSGHTYDTLAILPPADGGAPYGSLIRVSSHAVHPGMSRNTGWSHRFDFLSTTMRDGKWRRWSVNGPTSYLNPGACSAYDSRRKRFWWMAALSSSPPGVRYLDVATQQQMEAARYSSWDRAAPGANPDSPTLRHDPVRDLLVLTCTVGGQFVLAFLRCASPELGWVVPPLSATIPSWSGASHPFDFVPEANKIVLLTGADSGAVYDIVAPQDPTLTWTVTRRPVANLSIPAVWVTGKRWSYCPAAKSFVWMASSTSGVLAYRPFGV